MRADDEINRTLFKALQYFFRFFGRIKAILARNAHTEGRKTVFRGTQMLFAKDRTWTH